MKHLSMQMCGVALKMAQTTILQTNKPRSRYKRITFQKEVFEMFLNDFENRL